MAKAKPKTEAAPAPKPEYNRTAVYIGRRLGFVDKKVRQAFLLDDGKEVYYRGIKGVWIGYTYKCADGNMAVRPERVDVERKDNPEWEAADLEVDEYNARKRSEAKLAAKQTPAIKAAIAALAPLMRGRGWIERVRLIEHLAGKTGK